MILYFNSSRRCFRTGQLRIECAGNSICALRRKCRRRIEQAEISGMSYVNEAALKLFDCPGQNVCQLFWRRKIELGKLLLELGQVARRRNPTGDNSFTRLKQFMCQPILNAQAISSRWEEWRPAARLLVEIFEFKGRQRPKRSNICQSRFLSYNAPAFVSRAAQAAISVMRASTIKSKDTPAVPPVVFWR